MHGVQPKPKAIPTTNGKIKLCLYLSVGSFMSRFINLKLIISRSWSEKITIIVPAKILNKLELTNKIFPKSDAVEPKAIKTKEKPKVKKIVLITIRFLSFLISLSKEVPEIYEIYPGIIGRTQGDKKLINPAKNATDKLALID